MKAPSFDYAKPDTLADALALLGDPDGDARPLAGGQSLVPMMNFRLAAPSLLVDLGAIAELEGIVEVPDGIRIGAMTRYASLERCGLVAEHLPLLAEAIPHIAHPAIRNRGTIGGSIALADPAAEMPALALALDASILVVSAAGRRRIAADHFFLGIYETALEPGEIVEAIVFRKRSADVRHAFEELARRHGDYAMAGLALCVRGGEQVEEARLALFSVADRPLRAKAAEAALVGAPMRALADAAATAVAALDEVSFAGDMNAGPATKRHLAGVLLARAAARLAAREVPA